MFCTACGTAFEVGQPYCSKCGRALQGSPTYIRSVHRVRDHLRLVGIFWLIYSGIAFMSGAALFVAAHTFLGRFGLHGEASRHPYFLRPLLSLIAMFIIVKGLAGLAAGWGLLEKLSWARPLTLVLAFISLLNVPFGTALGIYTLWVLMSRDADSQYRSLSFAG